MTSEVKATPAPTPVPRAQVGLLFVLAAVAVFLGGVVGLAVVVAVAALRLSGAPATVIGGVGVALLVAAPLVLLANGLPSEGQVSPGIVTDTLVPHHLVFAGLALVCTWVVLDVTPRRVRVPHDEATGHTDGLVWPLWLRRALFVMVAVAALVAVVAVLQA